MFLQRDKVWDDDACYGAEHHDWALACARHITATATPNDLADRQRSWRCDVDLLHFQEIFHATILLVSYLFSKLWKIETLKVFL